LCCRHTYYKAFKIVLQPPHDDLRNQVFGTGHDGFAAEEDTHVVEFQDIGFATEFGRVVDARVVLRKGGVVGRIFWRAGIDRYLEEGSASAA